MYNIYLIYNTLNNYVYIGITRLPIEQRLQRHIKHSYDKNHTGFIYQHMRDIGRKNFHIRLLETTENPSQESFYISLYSSNPSVVLLNQRNGAAPLTKEYLYTLYVTEGLSSRDIAKRLKIRSKTTVLQLLRQHGITERHSRKLQMPETEIQLAYASGASIRGLAKKYNVDRDVIKRITKQTALLNSDI